MTEERFNELTHKYLIKEISDPEKAELHRFLAQGASEAQKNSFFQQAFDAFRPARPVFDSHQSKKILTEILAVERSPAAEPKTKHRYPLHPLPVYKIFIAASILILCSVGLYLFRLERMPARTVDLAQATLPRPTPEDSRKATLTLADGSTLVLDEAQNGKIARQQGVQISKNADGEITYRVTGNPDAEPGQPLFNTITTPLGGQYQVQLPDGTQVWLNAKSTLTFPVTFSEKERVVEISGEAYFEVAHDKTKPFRVRSSGQIVEVLGTKFNIQAYDQEPQVRTSLLEGSVRVERKQAGSVVLQPGEQAVQTVSSSALKIQRFNPEDVLAWKEGYFYFENADLKSVMRDIARWYGLEVIYDPGVVNQEFNGSISRYEDLKKVLELLELTETVHFTVKGRSVTVMK